MSASPLFPGLSADWSEFTHTLTTQHGPIFYREYLRKPEAKKTHHKRILYIIHGFGEQSDRFQHFPFYLHTCLDAIGFIDLPGHGQSPGQRGYISDYQICSDVALEGFAFFQSRYPQAEAHWQGSSMGALVSLRTLLQKKDLRLKSVVVNEAQIDLALQVPVIKDKMAHVLENIWGSLPMENGLKGPDLPKRFPYRRSISETLSTTPR